MALYVPLAGAGPSLQRAGVMGAAGIAAMMMSRPASRWYALVLAAAVTLALNPRASADPGWQLSFAAVAGILAWGRPLAAVLARAGEELVPVSAARPLGGAGTACAGACARPCRRRGVTVAATLATGPLVAFHFGAVPLAGLVANLLALPAVAPAMWLGMLKAALGMASAALPPAGAAADRLGPMTRIPLAYLEQLAERCAYLPGGRLELPLHSPAAVAAALRAPRRGAVRAQALGERRRTAVEGRRPRGARRRLAARPALVPGGGRRAGAHRPRARHRDRPRLAVTARRPDREVPRRGPGRRHARPGRPRRQRALRRGPPEAGVYRELRAAGVKRLDLVVATHQSRDHQGGFHDLIRRIRSACCSMNGDGTRDPDYHRMLAEADAEGIRRSPAHAGELLHAGG